MKKLVLSLLAAAFIAQPSHGFARDLIASAPSLRSGGSGDARNPSATVGGTTRTFASWFMLLAPLSSGTFTGPVTVPNFSVAGSPVFYKSGSDVASIVDADVGRAGYLRLRHAGQPAFDLGKDGVGNLYLGRFDASGAYVNNVFSVARPTGVLSFSQSPVAPTPPITDRSTNLATTNYVRSTMRDYDALMGVGYFDVWLDGVSFSNPASGSFAASLFRILYDGGAGNFTVGQQGGPYAIGAPNALRWNQTVASTNSTYRLIEARIEDASTFNSGKATLSFYASASAASTPLTVTVQQFFGTGGSPTPPVLVTNHNLSINNSHNLYEIVVDMPSTAANQFGSNVDDCVKIQLSLPASSTFDVTFSELRFERGGYRSPFSQVPLALKHVHLDRYIQYSRLSLGSTAMAAGQYVYGGINFKSEMRRAPTISFTGSARGNLGGASAPVVTSAAKYGATAYIQSAGAGPFYAVDEIVTMDARL